MNVPAVAAFFDHSTSVQITWLILHFLWQGLAIGAIVFLANLAVTRKSPRLRHGIAVAGMMAMIASVAVTWTLLQPAAPVVPTTSELVIPADISATMQAESLPMMDLEPLAEPPSPLEALAPTATMIYAIGVALMLLRLLLSALGIGRLRWSSTKAGEALVARVSELSKQIGVRAKPALKTCERVVVPFVVGVLKPAILLPSSVATGMTQSELDAILLHELAHLRRGDLIVNFVQRVAESMLFFHPAVWYVSQQITIERENCCDDVVLAQCNQQVYASALIRVAEACADRRQGKKYDMAPITALAATGASPSQLKRRVMRILGLKPTRQFHKPGWGVLLACVIAVTATVVHLQAQTEKDNAVAKAKDESAAGPGARRLTTTLSDDGSSVEFKASAEQMQRFTSILQHLSKNPRVKITSSNISRKGNRIKMIVKGANLDYATTQSAVRNTNQARLEALGRERESKTRENNTTAEVIGKLRFESFEDMMLVRGERMDEEKVKSIIQALRGAYGESTDNAPDAPGFLASVQMEAMGDAIMLRGGKADLERLVQIIQQIEQLTNVDPTPANDTTTAKFRIIELNESEEETRYGLEYGIRKLQEAGVASPDLEEARKDFDQKPRRLEVIQLHENSAAQVAATIEKIMGVAVEDENSRRYYSYFYHEKEEDSKDKFIVTADVENNRLLLRCNDDEYAMVTELLVQMGEGPAKSKPSSDNMTRLRLLDEQLKGKFGPDHPRRRAIARQIKLAEKIYAEEIAKDDGEDQLSHSRGVDKIVEKKPDDKKDEDGKKDYKDEKKVDKSTTAKLSEKPKQEADPKELDAKPTNGKLVLNFQGHSWPDMIDWYSRVTGREIEWQELPKGNVNLRSQRPMTMDETADILNRLLLGHGFAMLDDDNHLQIVKSIDPAFVPRVDSRRLVSHKLKGGDPLVVLRVLETMFADDDRIRLQTKYDSILAFATPEQHRKIEAAIVEIAPESTRTEVIPLTHLDPTKAVALVERFFALGEPGANEKLVVDATHAPDQLVVKGNAEQIEQIRELLRQLGEGTETKEPEGSLDSRRISEQWYGAASEPAKANADKSKKNEEAEKSRDATHVPKAGEENETTRLTGPVRFNIFGDEGIVIQGEKGDVDRVMKGLKAHWPTSKSRIGKKPGKKNVESVLTGPVRVEFIYGTDIFIVRGKQEDVDRIMKAVKQSRKEERLGNTETGQGGLNEP